MQVLVVGNSLKKAGNPLKVEILCILWFRFVNRFVNSDFVSVKIWSGLWIGAFVRIVIGPCGQPMQVPTNVCQSEVMNVLWDDPLIDSTRVYKNA